MFNYNDINIKMESLKHEYTTNINKFRNQFSNICNINTKTIPINCIIDDKHIINCNNDNINKSIKQLLRFIHPDKIKLIFNEDINDTTSLLNCSTTIINNNLNFNEAIKLLHKDLPKKIFTKICKKLQLSVEDINKIINDYDTTIDKHFDKEFLDLVERYNQLRSNTLYTFIYNKIHSLFLNLTIQFSHLLGEIMNKLFIIDAYVVTENILMAREEFYIEHYLERQRF